MSQLQEGDRELTHSMDRDKTLPVALYLFTIEIDGETYSGEVPGRSYDDAQQRVAYIGGTVTARVVNRYPDRLCAICADDIAIPADPRVGADDFPDMIEGDW